MDLGFRYSSTTGGDMIEAEFGGKLAILLDQVTYLTPEMEVDEQTCVVD